MLWKIFWAAFGFIYVIDVFICCDTVRSALWKRNKRERKWVEQHLGWESLQRNLFLIERNLWEGKLPIWAAHHDISLAQREKNVCKKNSTWAACSSAIPSLISAWEETLIILATWRQKTRKQMKDKIDILQILMRAPEPGGSPPTPLWCWCCPARPVLNSRSISSYKNHE